MEDYERQGESLSNSSSSYIHPQKVGAWGDHRKGNVNINNQIILRMRNKNRGLRIRHVCQVPLLLFGRDDPQSILDVHSDPIPHPLLVLRSTCTLFSGTRTCTIEVGQTFTLLLLNKYRLTRASSL
jgi:hypothetical protein